MNPLVHMIDTGASPQDMADYLDSLRHKERLRITMELPPRAQARLFAKVQDAFELDLNHFVPEDTEDLTEVIHWGRNTLPAFRRFQKRFCRPTAAQRGDNTDPHLWGYNANPPLVLGAVGPGYFVARHGADDTPVWIDYLLTPPDKVPHWPAIKPKTYRLSRFVYHGTIDRMRKVSEHVSIGAAFRGTKAIGAHFVLCREP